MPTRRVVLPCVCVVSVCGSVQTASAAHLAVQEPSQVSRGEVWEGVKALTHHKRLCGQAVNQLGTATLQHWHGVAVATRAGAWSTHTPHTNGQHIHRAPMDDVRLLRGLATDTSLNSSLSCAVWYVYPSWYVYPL